MTHRNGLPMASVVILIACGGADPGTQVALPDIDLSTETLEFGDVNWDEPVSRDLVIRNQGDSPVGISAIELTDDSDYDLNFVVTYDFSQMLCDEGSGESAKASASSKDVGTDTASDTGFYPGGEGDDTGEVEAVQNILDPGCQLPVHVTMDPVSLGEVYAAVRIVTMDEPTERSLSFFRDPDELFKVAILHGNAINEKGRIYADPTRLDFGFVYAGATELRYVTLKNLGLGDLMLSDYEFASNCDGLFSVTSGYDPTVGMLLEPGDSTRLEIAYLPLTEQDVTDQPVCAMKVHSDDVNLPEIEIELQANQQYLAEDSAPVVQLIRPEPGHIVNTQFLEVEIDMWDANQPASSLECRVKSALLLKGTTLIDCQPPDESGHVVVEIPADDIDPGVDTIEVKVTDAFGQEAYASTTILKLTGFPENDNDGDGYAAGVDCNDNDINTYPEGAERPDGEDNSCDPASACVPAACGGGPLINPCVDEGTIYGDDDRDCLSEVDGDCNDRDDDSYPGAPEVPDNRDNDCDGTVDEDTSNFDDDGDGFDEFNGDFDDDNAEINPGALEYCDGIDNDCDNYIDDSGACIPTDSIPVIVGGVVPEKTDITVGESVNVAVVAWDADGDDVQFAWTQDERLTRADHIALDNVSGPVVSFTAPNKLTDGSEKIEYELTIQVTDGINADWAFGYVTVHADPVQTTYTVGADQSGCDKQADQSVLLPVIPILVMALARRRRNDRAA